MKYFDEAHDIWQTFVPARGQSETVQGEMLRAVEKLRDGARRNGNINWDEGFEILLRYLSEKLSDPLVFDSATIEQSRSILRRLSRFDDPYLDNDLYDELSDRVVEYFKHYGSLPHKHNPSVRH